MRFLFLLCSVLFLSSCDDEILVKPDAMLRLEYPQASYKRIHTTCSFSFEMNENAVLQKKNNCALNIYYPYMDATIYMTYQPVHPHNLDSLLYDAQKLTYDHTIKAQGILEQPRADTLHNVYGMFYMINGNAATQSQFYATDSLHHFITGSLYFNAKPNFDSIYPAVVYLRNDIRSLMETLRWKEQNNSKE